jgi:hypothetical protein
MDRDEVIQELGAIAAELTQSRTHVEPILDDNGHGRKTVRRAWTTTQPALLDQLRTMAHEGLRVGARPPGSVGKPSSRPPGNFEALAVATMIQDGACRWTASLGMPFAGLRSATAPIRALVGAAPGLDEADLGQLLREMRYWRNVALVATGWVEPLWSPAVPCPMCERYASLRVDVDARAAYCGNRERDAAGLLVCGANWPAGTAGPLFAWIRETLERAA